MTLVIVNEYYIILPGMVIGSDTGERPALFLALTYNSNSHCSIRICIHWKAITVQVAKTNELQMRAKNSAGLSPVSDPLTIPGKII